MPKKKQTPARNLLQLHPHKHTGKLLHHRHTSYRALFVILALTGAVMMTPVGMTQAADYSVTAVVPAPLPAAPAIITSPSDNDTITQSNTIVKGDCPVIVPPIIVTLYEGSTFLGSQQCTSDGKFAIPVSFEPGRHTIEARVINFTGQTGATSSPVFIIYGHAAPTSSSAVNSGSGSSFSSSSDSNGSTTETDMVQTPSLYPQITSDNPVILFGPTKPAVWTGTLKGGTPPYSVTVYWGDGTVKRLKNWNEGQQTIKHSYAEARTYEVKIELRDATGYAVTTSITAISPAEWSAYTPIPGVGGLAGGSGGSGLLGALNVSHTWILYTLYITTVVVLTMLWHIERSHFARQYVPVKASRVVAAKRRRPPSKKRS
jgi:hypothetical protein